MKALKNFLSAQERKFWLRALEFVSKALRNVKTVEVGYLRSARIVLLRLNGKDIGLLVQKVAPEGDMLGIVAQVVIIFSGVFDVVFEQAVAAGKDFAVSKNAINHSKNKYRGDELDV